jgi:type II secretion system protein G
MRKRAFTLIELLVVVAIIGILAAIAVPNYHDALVRGRVAQVQIDLKTLGFALQSYRMDQNRYPRKNSNLEFFAVYLVPELTSPIPYMSSANLRDPFGPVHEYEEPPRFEFESDASNIKVAGLVLNSYMYIPYINFAEIKGFPRLRKEGFAVSSVGPDQMDSYIVEYPFSGYLGVPTDSVNDSVYDPSNGIRSIGDIGFFGGDIPRQGLVGG